MLEGVLFLVFPFHMLLFVRYGIPPYVEEAIRPCRTPEEEGAEIEAAAVLRDNEVDGFGIIVTNRRKRDGIEIWGGKRVAYVEGVVVVYVAVCVCGKSIEDV